MRRTATKKLKYDIASDDEEEEDADGSEVVDVFTLPSDDHVGSFPGYVRDENNCLGASKRCSIFSIAGLAAFLRDIPGKDRVFSTPKKDVLAMAHGSSKVPPNQDLLFKSVSFLFIQRVLMDFLHTKNQSM
jgi:hypothetical protein